MNKGLRLKSAFVLPPEEKQRRVRRKALMNKGLRLQVRDGEAGQRLFERQKKSLDE